MGVGGFLDFVSLSTRAPHVQMRKRNRTDRHSLTVGRLFEGHLGALNDHDIAVQFFQGFNAQGTPACARARAWVVPGGAAALAALPVLASRASCALLQRRPAPCLVPKRRSERGCLLHAPNNTILKRVEGSGRTTVRVPHRWIVFRTCVTVQCRPCAGGVAQVRVGATSSGA